MNGFLFNITNFIAAQTGDNTPEWMKTIVKPLQDIVLAILWPVLFVLSVVGIIYVITLGVQYARAESTDKREAAKTKMVNAIVGIVIMLVLIIVMLLVADNLTNIIDWIKGF